MTWMLVPENLLASFLRQRQQNPKRFRAEWQTKCKAAIRPIKRAADRNLCDCAPQHRGAIGDQQRDPHGRLPKIRAAPGRSPRRRILGTLESVAKPQLSDIKPKVRDLVPVLFSALGPIFLRSCTLYWGCRFAGYGNK
jgi:hypothetical protein